MRTIKAIDAVRAHASCGHESALNIVNSEFSIIISDVNKYM